MTDLKNAHPSSNMGATVCLCECVCVCGRISTRFSYLFWLMSTYPLATSNFNRPREFVAGGGGKRAGRVAAAASWAGGGGGELPACSTCYVQPRPRTPLCSPLSALCPLVHCKMLSVWPSWPGQELMWRTLFRTFAPEPTSSWRSSPSQPGQLPLLTPLSLHLL